jgi:iron complex outermembrane recepter protein
MRMLLIASALLSGVSVPVLAQTAPQADGQAPAAGIGDIVVTAERRTSTVQRSSLSIQVLSSEDVEAVRRPADLNMLVPGIQIGSAGVNPQIYIRGVGDAARNSRAQSGVQFNLDGVALARPSLATTSFFDLERVEVLKGPQGTLYGRNASGGAVNLITARPQLDEVGGSVTLEAGSFNLFSGEAALNLPLGSSAALRVSGKAVERDGYLSDGSQDQRTRAARARLLVEPSDSFSILTSFDYATVGGKGAGVSVFPVYNNDPWHSNTDTSNLPYPFQFGPTTAPFTAPNDRAVDSENWGATLEINADLGFAELAVIPAYREQSQSYVSYNSNFRFKEYLDDQTTSVEVRLSNDEGMFEWIVGGFYYVDNLQQQVYPLQLSTGASGQKTDEQIESESVFGNITFEPTEGLRLVGGLRYTHETNGGTFVNGTGAEPEIPFVQTGGTLNFVGTDDSRVTWKVGVEYDVGDASMIYATATTGFKAGGTNPTPCGGPSYEPEEITQFLAGSRNRFFGNSLQVNGEAFLIKANGQHVSSLTEVCNATNTGTTAGFLTFNVGKATVYGGNIDLTWAPTDVDRFTFFAEYVKSEADEFVFQQIGTGAYAASQQSDCSATNVGGPLFSIDCSGLPLPRVPKWTIQSSYRHDFLLPNEGVITPSLTIQHSTSRELDVGYGPNGRAPGYTLANFEIGYTAPDDAWSLSFYARNITNAKVYSSGTSIVPTAPNGFRYYTVNIEPPRSYGVRLSADF